MTFEARKYRVRSNYRRFSYLNVVIKETDLWIGVPPGSDNKMLSSVCLKHMTRLRDLLDEHIRNFPGFANSFVPLDGREIPSPEIRSLYAAAWLAGTGPMAGIAGLFALEAGKAIIGEGCQEVVVENGGDVFVSARKPVTIAIHAGKSPLSDQLAIRLPGGQWGICTSSGTVGHSRSFGQADAVAVVAADPVTADVMATAVANRVKSEADIEPILEKPSLLEHIEGVLIIKGEHAGIKGNLEIIRI